MDQMLNSSKNEKLKNLSKLYRRKYREREKKYVIEGVHLIKEALINGQIPDEVFVREGFEKTDEGQNIISALKSGGADIYYVSAGAFDRAVDTETPQGIAATASIPATGFLNVCDDVKAASCGGGKLSACCDMKSASCGDDRQPVSGGNDAPAAICSEDKPHTLRSEDKRFTHCVSTNVLVLDRLQDPGNIGTAIRTADAAGFRDILVMKGTADIFSPKTVRAAAGSLYRVRFSFESDPNEALRLLKSLGKKTVCTSPSAKKAYFEEDIAHDTALIIGNEANGACDEFMQGSDIRILIPMEGSIESLNAAAAASIIMYESVRQRSV